MPQKDHFMLKRRKPTTQQPLVARHGTVQNPINNGGGELPGKPFQERPRICLIDIEPGCVETLKSHGFNCYSGTLGSLVQVPNTYKGIVHQCLLNFDFPPNLREYDIVVIDLQKQTKVKYEQPDHVHTETKGHEQLVFLSSFPETLFDPRPFSASILGSKLHPLLKKDSILVVFADWQETVGYHPITITAHGPIKLDIERHGLYDFYSDLPSQENVTGLDTTVVSREGDEITSLLQRHNREATYRIAFFYPKHWDGHQQVKNENFISLMEAAPDQIVAFAHSREKNVAFFFPRIKEKQAFLVELFQRVLPGIVPTVFPYSTQFAWLSDSFYRLPNETILLHEKEQLRHEYETRLKELDGKLETNREEYGYLHDLLTRSGSTLVKTVEKYLSWMGFDKVINVDETDLQQREEDLRVETDRGLLVIEVKGIAGTSTDSECSQISKIKYRRSKERGSFDVFGLYLVNHQRFLPPENRTNPPFNATQIHDAKNDERGLLTTYELFKLFFNVIEGHISKEDARLTLFQIGLVTFNPSKATKVPPPYEIHHNGSVLILRADGLHIKTGMSVVLNDSGRFRSTKILEIQINGATVEVADSGEVGIKLSEKISKDTEVWLHYDS